MPLHQLHGTEYLAYDYNPTRVSTTWPTSAIHVVRPTYFQPKDLSVAEFMRSETNGDSDKSNCATTCLFLAEAKTSVDGPPCAKGADAKRFGDKGGSSVRRMADAEALIEASGGLHKQGPRREQ
jgi:hypothetical protein